MDLIRPLCPFYANRILKKRKGKNQRREGGRRDGNRPDEREAIKGSISAGRSFSKSVFQSFNPPVSLPLARVYRFSKNRPLGRLLLFEDRELEFFAPRQGVDTKHRRLLPSFRDHPGQVSVSWERSRIGR